jgi:hypothetical protein
MCASASAGKARPALSLILCQPRAHWSSGWTRLLSPRPPARNDSQRAALPPVSRSSWRLASSSRSGLTRAGRSRCTSMSWLMTSKPPSRGSWHWAPGASRAQTAGHGSMQTRPGTRSVSYPARRGLRQSENHQARRDCGESHRRLSESLVIDPPSLSNPDTSASAVCRDGCCATVEIISPCRVAATIVIFVRSTAS